MSALPSPPELTRSDFAALRAWVQGLAPDWIAGRYLQALLDEDGLAPDARVVVRHLSSLRDTLVMRAHQHGRDDLAAVLLSRSEGSNRGMDRVVDAITELERRGTPRPRPEHRVAMWFAPALASRLDRSGVRTVGDLVSFCNGRGHAWWRALPRIGQRAAAAVTGWLRTHGGALVAAGGCTIAPHALSPTVLAVEAPLAPGSAVPPLELMRPPGELDGSAGENRGRGFCAMAARNDFEAVQAWLERLDGATFRAYRKEAERLIAWAIVERERPLSSLTFEDCIAYRDWLGDPQPAHRWVGPARPRTSPLWRPFRGPLAPRSVSYTLVVLGGLFDFLCSQGYLATNPWRRVPPPRGVTQGLKVSRALSREAWRAFDKWLRDQAAIQPDARAAHAVVMVLRDTGLRRFELARADRRGCSPSPAPGVWGDLRVVGKGGKERLVTLSQRAADALQAHWADRGASFEDAAEGPLIQPLARPATRRSVARPADAGYSDSGLHAVVVRWASRFAASTGADHVRCVTAHVLRHTFVTLALEDGAALTAVQATAGHESVATTSIYSRARDEFRRREVAKTFLAESER